MRFRNWLSCWLLSLLFLAVPAWSLSCINEYWGADNIYMLEIKRLDAEPRLHSSGAMLVLNGQVDVVRVYRGNVEAARRIKTLSVRVRSRADGASFAQNAVGRRLVLFVLPNDGTNAILDLSAPGCPDMFRVIEAGDDTAIEQLDREYPPLWRGRSGGLAL